MNRMASIIQLKGVKKVYGKGDSAVNALNSVNIDIARVSTR